jgi:hypothetical protein
MVFTVVSSVGIFLDSYIRFWLHIPYIMHKEYNNSKALLNLDWLWGAIYCIWVQITQNFILSKVSNKREKAWS